jgi:DNA polymerase III subunit gamma/tau
MQSRLTKRGDSNLRVCYRPMQHKEFYGFNVEAVIKALNSPNHPRTFLFHGDTGTGKTSAARYIAMLINCLDSDGANPCLQCENCKRILSNDKQLVIELNMADKTGIEDTRKELKKLHTRPYKANAKKVLILDEAQQLTNAAQQGWLKTLEEPPEWAYIILCTTEPAKFRGDVYNRLTTFQFHTLTEEDGIEFLLDLAKQENLDFIDAEKAASIYSHIGGRHRELINAIEKLKLEGSDAINDLIRASDKTTSESIGKWISGITTKEAPMSWVIHVFYDLVNQFGDVAKFSRALSNYLEKSIRNQAGLKNKCDHYKLNRTIRILRVAKVGMHSKNAWELIPTLQDIYNED